MQGGGKQTLQVHCSWKTEGPMIAKSGQRGKITVNWFSQMVEMGYCVYILPVVVRAADSSSLLRST